MAEALDHTLTTEYRGARIVLAFDGRGAASLAINGIERQTANASAGETVHLSSTVQTDYEWHEFIEGVVRPTPDGHEATLLANKAELARETFGTQASA